MNIKSFFKSLFDSFRVELQSTEVDDLQKEIAEGFLTYFGQFKNGDVYILEDDHLSKLTSYELLDELPFSEEEIEGFLTYIKSKNLNTHLQYKDINIDPNKSWIIGGMKSVLEDFLIGRISYVTFSVKVEFNPSINLIYEADVVLSSNKENGRIMTVRPSTILNIDPDNGDKEYMGYYSSCDGTMDAQVVIDKFNLSWNRANVFKYIVRAGKKDPSKEIEDLEKAIQYLKFEIAKVNGK